MDIKAYQLVPPEVYEKYGALSIGYFIDDRIIETLHHIYNFFHAEITINNWHEDGPFRYRGWRPMTYYAGQLSGSQHLFGRAVDCDIAGVKAHEARDVIMNHQKHFPHIKRIEDDVNWVHFDLAEFNHHGIHLFKP